MRISDIIANKILDVIEERFNLYPKRKDYLDAECAIADIITKEINYWLNYDVDLNEKRD
jgi:hypothetical protein